MCDRIYILENGYDKIVKSNEHSAEKAIQLIENLKLNRYKYLQECEENYHDRLPKKTYSMLGQTISKTDYSKVLYIYAFQSGYILESFELAWDLIWSTRLTKKLLKSYPDCKILATASYDTTPFAALAFYENGEHQRTLSFNSEDLEDPFYCIGKKLRQEETLLQGLPIDNTLEEDEYLVLEEEKYKGISPSVHVHEMIEILSKEFLETDQTYNLNSYGPHFSIFIKRPWYSFF